MIQLPESIPDGKSRVVEKAANAAPANRNASFLTLSGRRRSDATEKGAFVSKGERASPATGSGMQLLFPQSELTLDSGFAAIQDKAVGETLRAESRNQGLFNNSVHAACARILAGVIALALAAVLLAGPASAQQAAECPDPSGNPTAGNRVSCEEPADSSDKIDIDLNSFDITTTGEDIHAVYGLHQGSGGDADIEIDVTDGAISTTGEDAHGVFARHCELDTHGNCETEGTKTGDIDVDVTGASITTNGYQADGILAEHGNTGDIDITTENVTLSIEGRASLGITGWHRGNGETRVTATGGSVTLKDSFAVGIYASQDKAGNTGDAVMNITNVTIKTQLKNASASRLDGIRSWHLGTGDIDITVSGGSITMAGERSWGVNGWHRGSGDVDIDVTGGASITTTGKGGRGVYGSHNQGTAGHVDIDVKGSSSITTSGEDAHGVLGWHGESGDIDIDVTGDASITTKGASGHGVYGLHWKSGGTNTGDINIGVADATIKTESTAYGILAYHTTTGDIDVDVTAGASITTKGASAYGVYGLHTGAETAAKTADIDIDLTGGSITTSGAGAHGVYAGHGSGKGTMATVIGAGASVTASGASASGVQIGRFNTNTTDNIPDGTLERAAKAGADGYRRQTVTVNGSVTGGSGDAAAVYLAGGGKVAVGSSGSLRASSGAAVRAARKLSTEAAPKLHVSLTLDSRDIAAIFGDDYILNDGGGTTVVVNGVKLHDAADGPTGLTASTGTWNVTLRAKGVTVDDSDPADWVVSDLKTVIADRDFSAADFIVVAASPPLLGVGGEPVGPGAVCDEPPDPDGSIVCIVPGNAENINIAAGEVSIATTGDDAPGVLGWRKEDTEGNAAVSVGSGSIATSGDASHGVHGLHQGSGGVGVSVTSASVSTAGAASSGVCGEHEGTGAVAVGVAGGSVTTAGEVSHGVCGRHAGSGQVGINVSSASPSPVITTTGDASHGVYGRHMGAGGVDIDVTSGVITTHGAASHGVHGLHTGTEGGIDIDVTGGSVTTKGAGSYGVYGLHRGAEGALALLARDAAVETLGTVSRGVCGEREGAGDLEVKAAGGYITTSGDGAHGVCGLHRGMSKAAVEVTENASVGTTGAGSYGAYALHSGTGGIDMTASASVATAGMNSHGVHAAHSGAGDVAISVAGGSIETKNAGSYGVYALHSGTGSIDIDAAGGSVETEGVDSHGVYGLHQGTGDIAIEAQGGAITTTGAGSHGVYAAHDSGGGTIAALIGEDASVAASGADASGVRIGGFDTATNALSGAARMGADGYRMQTVTARGAVRGGSGEGAGVYLAGGGKVVVESSGSVGAASGIGIRAARKLSTEAAPRLHFEVRRPDRSAADAIASMSDVIGGDWILNDGGGTTIVVNGVKLHDAAAGPTGVWIPQGARDVGLREKGVTVDDSDPDAWVISAPKAVVADRDFSAADFIEVYAPRAAVYEALPGFLLRLNGGGLTGKRMRLPGSLVWTRLSGGRGSYAPGRASAGAEYDYDRFEAEAGLDLSLGNRFAGSVSARHARGSAEVDAPTGGGAIDARGLGFALAASWRGESGWYARGGFSLTNYDVDLSSNKRGGLKEYLGGSAGSADFEAGRRVALEKMDITPRLRLARAEADADVFTDALGARVGVVDAARFTGAAGLAVDAARAWEGGNLSLRGSLDVERVLGGAETAVSVSGERLESESAKTRVLLGLGVDYRSGRFAVGAEVSAGGLGSDDASYAGRVTFGMRF